MMSIYTIGHSNHEIAAFIALLRLHAVTAVADVRSHPASRRFPQFDRNALQRALEAEGIRYVFLGDGLGARPSDPACYTLGRADFDLIRRSRGFIDAFARLKSGARHYRISLMCAEREPADCHRTWLVAQALHEAGETVEHILADGVIEPHRALLTRVSGADPSTGSLFDDEDEILTATARAQAARVAYRVAHTQDEEDEE